MLLYVYFGVMQLRPLESFQRLSLCGNGFCTEARRVDCYLDAAVDDENVEMPMRTERKA